MKKSSRLYLARHGQVQGYDSFPAYGHTDVEMTEVGLLQMEHLADRLRLTEIHAVYSSDLKRAVTGARIIGRHHDVPITAVPRLREVYFGDWEGKSFLEIRTRFPELLTRRETELLTFEPPGGGESIGHLAERVMAGFGEILEKNGEKNVLLVAHAAVNRVILCNALGLDLKSMFSLQQDYGCLNIIDYFPDRTLVRLVNG
ncbi:MAG: histidine phosphatase family protein [Thermodesulfobacteriota bacterium]